MTRMQRYSLGILLALQLTLGMVAAIAQPLWLGHEPDYFNVVRFLADNRRLPTRSDYESGQRDADITQATQAPLFPYVAMPLVALLDDGDPVPPGVYPGLICEGAAPTSYRYALTTEYNMPLGGTPAAGYGLRLLNLAFALGMTVTVYFAARQIAADNHSLALLAATFIAFQPQIFGLGVFISGESLLLLISGANLLFALRLVRGETIRTVDLAGAIVTALLGPLTKTNGYVLVIGTAALLAYLILRQVITDPRSRATRVLLAGAGVLAFGMIALSIFNYVQYGSIVGRYQNMLSIAVNRLEDLTITNLVAMLRDTYYDYTGAFPVHRQKALWLYTLGGVFGLILFLAHMLGAAIRRNTRQLTADGLLFVYALGAFILVLMRANLVFELTPDKTHTPLRYYISGLPAMAVMLSIGWHALAPHAVQRAISKRSTIVARLQPWRWIGWAWALVWIGVVAWNIAPHVMEHPSRSVYSPDEFETLAAENGVSRAPDDPSIPADAPRLLAYDASAGDDGILRLTGYWQVAETPTLNYAARVRVEDGSGSSTTCELIPHDGRYPVTRWEPDQIVAVEMEVPNCAGGSAALAGPLDVTIDWLPANTAGQFVGEGIAPAQPIAVDAALPHARTCLASLGVIADVFQVIQYNGPLTATAGMPFLPSVNWYVRDDVPQGNFVRDYVIKHNASDQVYVCRGVPRMGNHRIANWRRGEIVYFDQCGITLPPDAPVGEYSILIGVFDVDASERLSAIPSETGASTGTLLAVATVTVQPGAD